jgi:hypothetical protein
MNHLPPNRALYIGTLGLQRHTSRMHGEAVLPDLVPPPPLPNSQLIQVTFQLEETVDLQDWQDSFAWLNDPSFGLTPPPFRYTLYQKLPSTLKHQVHDIFLRLLLAFKNASRREHLDHAESELAMVPLLRLILLFQLLILAPPGPESKERKYSRLIPHRLRLFRLGQIKYLYDSAYSFPVRPQRSPPSHPDPQTINRQVETAVRHGNLSAALQRLDPQPRAVMDAANLERIKSLHPPPVIEAARLPIAPPANTAAIFQFDKLPLTNAASTRDKAPGYLADHPDFLLDVSPRRAPGDPAETGSSLLGHLYLLLAQRKLPSQCWQDLSPNVMMALEKAVGLRPIGMGTSFKRNMNKHGTMAVRERAAKHMLPHQFAIGIPGGMDFMIHKLQYEVGESVYPALPLHQRRALLKLDFVNMFNSVSRAATREELANAFPE